MRLERNIYKKETSEIRTPEELRRLNIQNNVVEGLIVIDINGKKVTYPHHFNEIKIGNDWYVYDFTLNLISEKWKEPEYKRALKFIKMPVKQGLFY